MTTRLGFLMHSKRCKESRFLDAVAQSYRTLREQYLTDIQNVEFGCRRLKELGKFRILKIRTILRIGRKNVWEILRWDFHP